jgi:hypothetical protein
VLDRLEMVLKKLPAMSDPDQQALVGEAGNPLKLGRQLEAEGGWGYAQMHGYIGLGLLERLNR